MYLELWDCFRSSLMRALEVCRQEDDSKMFIRTQEDAEPHVIIAHYNPTTPKIKYTSFSNCTA
jgi:hypothetical protein